MVGCNQADSYLEGQEANKTVMVRLAGHQSMLGRSP